MAAARRIKLRPIGIGHNGGPPLREQRPRKSLHSPEWGPGGIKTYFHWKRAHRAAWRSQPVETRIRHDDKAEAIGLTFREYTLEIIERGRYLQKEDTDAIAVIKAKRKGRHQF